MSITAEPSASYPSKTFNIALFTIKSVQSLNKYETNWQINGFSLLKCKLQKGFRSGHPLATSYPYIAIVAPKGVMVKWLED